MNNNFQSLNIVFIKYLYIIYKLYMQNFQRLNNSETLKLYEYFMNIILYYENIQYNILLNY